MRSRTVVRVRSQFFSSLSVEARNLWSDLSKLEAFGFFVAGQMVKSHGKTKQTSSVTSLTGGLSRLRIRSDADQRSYLMAIAIPKSCRSLSGVSRSA
jgi:hypothetical protein